MFLDLSKYQIILASGSPRRQALLREMGLDFTTIVKPVDESYPSDLKGQQITDYIAKKKAEAHNNDLSQNTILITSDTLVMYNDCIMGKPSTLQEAKHLIQTLSGNTHQVVTSVCFTCGNGQQILKSATTKVTFSSLTLKEINFYLETFKPMDKAGAYGIQEWIGLIGVEHIEGSYFNVVGLPTHLVYQTLKEIATDE